MKNVQIMHILDKPFFKDNIQYKYESSYNSRIVCHKVDDPEQKIQFSCYDTVQVTDDDAIAIKAFLIDVYRSKRSNLAEIKRDIIQLEENNVKCYLDHFLPSIISQEDEFNIIQLDENCYYVNESKSDHFASVGNPFIATRLGDLKIVETNLLPEVKKIFKNAKIVKVKINSYSLIHV